MSKKAKKAARELQRLQNLYQSANVSQPIGVSQAAVARPISTAGHSTAAVSHSHIYVKRDLLTLAILIILMLAALIGLNLLAEKTAFGDVLAKMVGKIF
jgi:hypothetical protein